MHRGLPSGIQQCLTPLPVPPNTIRRRICRTRRDLSVKNPYCGCPMRNETERCYHCEVPGTVQARVLYPPKRVAQRSCDHLVIPAVKCPPQEPPRIPALPCTINWNVEEPGANDSYGLNGLNWYDWQMDHYNKSADKEPTREGLSLATTRKDFPDMVCKLPVECYSRSPDPVKCNPFPGRVNYNRDWRCCSAIPPPPWRPPFA